ncbi:AAA family ATPase [Marinilactibacillus kalidii]|uniref:AAA family ATPase n=1 Tax=Marinilactibacillus kalidii TaxID=2820274 RepID=UPI001ABDE087|nr:AAA family ATPase [Marinilactibacillus kalidii]
MTAKTIINANQKGGVGKTTSTSFEAIIASLPNEEFNNKCLLIDFDKQANATSIMGKTFDKGFPSTVISAVRDNDLKSAIVELTPNLHMIAGGGDMAKYGLYLELLYPFKNDTSQHVAEVTKQRTFHFSKMLDPLRELYDYIWIDVGPSTDIKVDNAMVCADYFVIPQETKTYSFEGSLDIINVYLQTLIDDFGEDFKGEVLGLLPFLLQPKRDLHESIIAQTKEAFGENFTFNAIVNNQKRIDDYPEYGITVIDHHDRKVFALFADIFKELEERIKLFEKLGDIPEDYSYQPTYLDGNKLTDFSRRLDLGTFEPKAGA